MPSLSRIIFSTAISSPLPFRNGQCMNLGLTTSFWYTFSLSAFAPQAPNFDLIATTFLPACRYLLFTACATFSLNSHKRYHKSLKYCDFDNRLCNFWPFQAQAVVGLYSISSPEVKSCRYDKNYRLYSRTFLSLPTFTSSFMLFPV